MGPFCSQAEMMISSWLSDHLEEDKSCQVDWKDIICALENDFPQLDNAENKITFSLIKALFPDTVLVNERVKGDWLKCTKVCRGIKVNTNNVNNMICFRDIENYKPLNWFVINKTNELATFGNLSNDTFNGHRILKQLQINTSGDVSVFVSETRVELSPFQINSTIQLTASSIKGVFRCVSNLICICNGKEVSMSDTGNTTGSYFSGKKGMKEVHMCDDRMSVIFRHSQCHKVVSYMSRTKSCCRCSQLYRYKRRSTSNENKENMDNNVKHCDTMAQLKVLAPNLNQKQLLLINSQITASNIADKRGMRWPKEIISMSLTVFNRNPKAYQDLTENGWLRLPSEKLLRIYKNAVIQKPGIVPDMMRWMRQEADKQIQNPSGYYGGLILDEMSIQEDLQIVNTRDGSKLVGIVDVGEECQLINVCTEGSNETRLANHVMQYVFHGLSGFRWPFCNNPNTQAPPTEIFINTWKYTEALCDWGFKPIYCCMDGSSNNRAFLKMHFQEDDLLGTGMKAPFYKDPSQDMIFMMDPSHLIKKIRNSILSSGIEDFHVRSMEIPDYGTIMWKMWVDAYKWDKEVNPFQIHNKLTDDHLFPNDAQKMRNKLANDVLDDEMLHLMQCYQASLSSQHGEALNGAISFLQNTSFIVSFFSDSRPIRDLGDQRLKKFDTTYSWFKAWEQQICDKHSLDSHKRHKELMTMETREDLDFLYHGFNSLVRKCINQLNVEIVPSRVNSDIIENIFCQQRGLYHGATTNPTYNSYRTGINSIILGQTTISRKSNCGGSKAEPYVKGQMRIPFKVKKHNN